MPESNVIGLALLFRFGEGPEYFSMAVSVVRAGDIAVKKYPWTFKIVNLANPDCRKYFAAGCEREMKTWMREIRSQLIIANADLLSIAKIVAPHTVDDSEVESSIYGDSAQNVASFSVEGRRSSSNSFSSEYPDEESDDSDDYDKIDERELVRPLPPVPGTNGTTSSSDAGMASAQRASSLPKAQPRPPPRQKSTQYEPTEAHVPKLKSPPQVKQKPLLDKPRPPARRPNAELGQVPLPPRNKVPSPPAKKNEMFNMNDVCWYESDKQAADQIIRNIGKEGVFMVRQSDNPLCVKTLVCFVDGRPVKFMIKQNPTSGMYYIHDEWTFPSIPALLEHYHHNNLPKKITCLTEPYTKYTTK
ncbi:hypothetical protein LSH36_91g07036 [Paralvinella palmiformis]|uniref:SH2 domain-containing protein n=1 Tax=Paralvinella palmiformis TaxID=53620 RepID=A0AAD9K142_9ANNE|nr:hypothetical protein LSH36_91g07036 [Paralvinella palmiformis]